MPPADAPELERFILNQILDKESQDHESRAEGIVIARVSTIDYEGWDASPLKVWRIKNGELVQADENTFEKAFHGKQNDWPPSLYLFYFKDLTHSSAVVDVMELYDTGTFPSGRGGMATFWQLQKINEDWQVVSRHDHLHMD